MNTPSSEYVDEGLRFLRTTDIREDGTLTGEEGAVFIDEAAVRPEHRLHEGDLLFSRSGTLGRCLRFEEALGPASFAGYLVRFRPTADTDPRFVAYCAQTSFFVDAIKADAVSSTISNFNAEKYASLPLPWWPMVEQRAIADYLDTETTRIDALITKKRRMIELLNERRISEIDNLIEDGASPLVQIRHISKRITSGPRGWAEFASAEGTPFLRITNIQRKNIELDMTDTLFVQAPSNAESRRTSVRAGDVLVSITADIGSVGVARPSQAGSFVSQHVCLITPTGCESDWLAYGILSSRARAQLDAGQYGGTKTQLSLGDVASLKIRLPDRDDQRRRLADLARRLSAVDTAIDRLTRQIDLLVERRQALITAAVTGELPEEVAA